MGVGRVICIEHVLKVGGFEAFICAAPSQRVSGLQDSGVGRVLGECEEVAAARLILESETARPGCSTRDRASSHRARPAASSLTLEHVDEIRAVLALVTNSGMCPLTPGHYGAQGLRMRRDSAPAEAVEACPSMLPIEFGKAGGGVMKARGQAERISKREGAGVTWCSDSEIGGWAWDAIGEECNDEPVPECVTECSVAREQLRGEEAQQLLNVLCEMDVDAEQVGASAQFARHNDRPGTQGSTFAARRQRPKSSLDGRRTPLVTRTNS